MNKRFASIHARAICHATENLDRVKEAVANLIPSGELVTTRVEGHHGNRIETVEVTVRDEREISKFLSQFGADDLHELEATISSRIDKSCQFFLRADKQAAYEGRAVLTTGEDAISMRMKVLAFPSRPDVAEAILREHINCCIEAGTQVENSG